jgi:hypothetical protein
VNAQIILLANLREFVGLPLLTMMAQGKGIRRVVHRHPDLEFLTGLNKGCADASLTGDHSLQLFYLREV